MEVVINLFVLLLFAFFGYLVGGKISPAHKTGPVIALVVFTIAAGFIGVNTRLVSVLNLAVYLNICLQGLGSGMLLGLLVRKNPVSQSAL